jgi:hypothetical protein
MMDHKRIIESLNANQKVFSGLLSNKNKDEYLWKPEAKKWCLLEIVCHLYDEEREDFRARVKHTLETPDKEMPMFDQIAWVKDRKYVEQNYKLMVEKLLDERQKSIAWLLSIKSPQWKNAYDHQKLGPLSAEHFLANWIAHDLLHIRQLVGLHFQYLKETTNNKLIYAGSW